MDAVNDILKASISEPYAILFQVKADEDNTIWHHVTDCLPS